MNKFPTQVRVNSNTTLNFNIRAGQHWNEGLKLGLQKVRVNIEELEYSLNTRAGQCCE